MSITTRAAAVGMVDRIHHLAAHRRTYSAPAFGAGFADRAQIMFLVTYTPDRCATIDVHFANFSRMHAQLRVRSFARQQLNRSAGRPSDLRALSRKHLDAMNRRADGD